MGQDRPSVSPQGQRPPQDAALTFGEIVMQSQNLAARETRPETSGTEAALRREADRPVPAQPQRPTQSENKDVAQPGEPATRKTAPSSASRDVDADTRKRQPSDTAESQASARADNGEQVASDRVAAKGQNRSTKKQAADGGETADSTQQADGMQVPVIVAPPDAVLAPLVPEQMKAAIVQPDANAAAVADNSAVSTEIVPIAEKVSVAAPPVVQANVSAPVQPVPQSVAALTEKANVVVAVNAPKDEADALAAREAAQKLTAIRADARPEAVDQEKSTAAAAMATELAKAEKSAMLMGQQAITPVKTKAEPAAQGADQTSLLGDGDAVTQPVAPRTAMLKSDGAQNSSAADAVVAASSAQSASRNEAPRADKGAPLEPAIASGPVKALNGASDITKPTEAERPSHEVMQANQGQTSSPPPPAPHLMVQPHAAPLGLAAEVQARLQAQLQAPGPHQAVTIDQVPVTIAARAAQGQTQFDIRLEPQDLGRIDVRMQIDRDGYVKTHLVVESRETYELLQRDQRQLERTLQQSGMKTEGGVDVSLRSDTGGQNDRAFTFNQNRDDPRPRFNGSGDNFMQNDAEDSRIVDHAAQLYHARMAANRGGIDVRI